MPYLIFLAIFEKSKVLESKKGGPLKTGQSHNLPKIKYGISEPHGDLLQWNLSWAFTFNILVHQEGGV